MKKHALLLLALLTSTVTHAATFTTTVNVQEILVYQGKMILRIQGEGSADEKNCFFRASEESRMYAKQMIDPGAEAMLSLLLTAKTIDKPVTLNVNTESFRTDLPSMAVSTCEINWLQLK